MRLNFKSKLVFGFSWVILLSSFVFVHQVIAQKPSEKSQLTVNPVRNKMPKASVVPKAKISNGVNKEVKEGTRIVISTSGPAKFSSHWLDEPFRLVVEFQSRSIISQMDDEVILNQGVIKRVTASFFGRGQKRSLKSLTFELTQKVPYKIWQENNAILLDIQAPLEAEFLPGQAPLEVPVFQTGGEEIFTEGETSEVIIKRLEAMDAALIQVAESQALLKAESLKEQAPLDREAHLMDQTLLETPEAEVIEVEKETVEEIDKAEEEVVTPKTIVLPEVVPIIERKAMVSMVFWLWVAEAILILTLGFLLWRRRRASSNQKLKELKAKLQKKITHNEVKKNSLQEEKESQQQEEERPWIPERLQEKRAAPRLPLTRDFSKTITLRVKSYVTHQSIKSFVNNISSNGLCFMTREEFKDKEPINLSLIFYGDMSSITSIQAHIAWKSSQEGINYYGVSFDLLEEKGKLELNRFIEARIGR